MLYERNWFDAVKPESETAKIPYSIDIVTKWIDFWRLFIDLIYIPVSPVSLLTYLSFKYCMNNPKDRVPHKAKKIYLWTLIFLFQYNFDIIWLPISYARFIKAWQWDRNKRDDNDNKINMKCILHVCISVNKLIETNLYSIDGFIPTNFLLLNNLKKIMIVRSLEIDNVLLNDFARKLFYSILIFPIFSSFTRVLAHRGLLLCGLYQSPLLPHALRNSRSRDRAKRPKSPFDRMLNRSAT